MRPTIIRRWIGWGLAVAVFSVVRIAPAGAAYDPYTDFFDASLGDLTEELQFAEEQGKRAIFVFFEMDECPFCHRMKYAVFNRPEVQAYFREQFLNLAIDIEGDVEITDFNGRLTTHKAWARDVHRVRLTPVMMFFDLAGRPLARYTGATPGAPELLWYGEFVVSGAYREMTFAHYRRAKRRQAVQ